jgi:hypothetical protein
MSKSVQDTFRAIYIHNTFSGWIDFTIKESSVIFVEMKKRSQDLDKVEYAQFFRGLYAMATKSKSNEAHGIILPTPKSLFLDPLM